MSNYEDLKWGGKLDACEICGKNVAVIGDARPVHAQCEAESVSPAPQPAKDACEVCKGESGGVPGNENIVGGVVICDYCSSKTMKPVAAPQEVKRWDWTCRGMTVHVSGKFMHHSEYQRVKDRAEKAEAAYVSLCEELADVKATNEELVRMVAKYKHERDDSRNIARAEKLVREKAETELADMRKALQSAQQDLEVAHKLLKSVKP